MTNFYRTKKWIKKRSVVLRLHDYLCQECKRYGKTKQANTVHHIYPLEDYPEYALVTINLLSLCNKCHNEMHERQTDKLTDKGMYWQKKVRLPPTIF